jgi:cephalosporin hydroxylase
MRSYDIKRFSPYFEEVEEAARAGAIDFKFEIKDSLLADFESTQLLFVDGKHTFEQVRAELRIHAPKVECWIILHDTTTLAQVGDHYQGRGIWPAIEEFLEENRDQWKIKARLTNCNGLTILERL